MKSQLDTSGFDEFSKKLQNLSGNIALTDLFTDEFISRNTNFATLQDMVDASGFENPNFLETQEWSDFVAGNSQFSDGQEMMQSAVGECAQRKLGS